jgi:predicted solute-binding protein
MFISDQILLSFEECRGELESSAMAKVSNTSVVLLMLLIAAWRTTPVLSHAKPSKPAAEPELDYGPRYDAIFFLLPCMY